MSLTLSGSGTIGGLVAGGLPDATVTAADLASGAARTNFGAGAVLQVVSATYYTQTSTTSTSYVDTGLSATITPTSASSKIVIFVVVGGAATGAALNGVNLQLVRSSTPLMANILNVWCRVTDIRGTVPMNLYDTPNTTSATTYSVKFASQTGDSTTVQASNATSTITLMEIAG